MVRKILSVVIPRFPDGTPILDNKKLFNLGFYDKNWKTKDIKVVGTVHSDYQLEIDEIL